MAHNTKETLSRVDANRLYSLSVDMLGVATFDGYFIHLNPAWEKILGYTLDELKSCPYLEYVHPGDREATLAESQKIANGASVLLFENRYKHKNGHYIWLSWNATPYVDNNLIYFVARDITSQKIQEESRLKLLQQLEMANKNLDDFAYVVSHDLKAPLRGIQSLATWLADDYRDKLDEHGQELLNLLSHRSRRMHQLIEGILRYSRIGRVRDTFVEIHLKILISEVIASLAPPENIEISVPANLPTITAEYTEIQQLFQNLLSNALQYADESQGKIWIDYADKDKYWEFSVADNGPGIEPKYHGKIFVIFQTLEARDETNSTGIGLSIVKKIVEAYGGTIWVESEFGQGAKFYFTLPKGR